jgi:hypothetical protein
MGSIRTAARSVLSSAFCYNLYNLKGLGHHNSLSCEGAVRRNFNCACALWRKAFAVSLRMSAVQLLVCPVTRSSLRFVENLCLMDGPALPGRASDFSI